MKKIGFIGLGKMGFSMASNLLMAGYDLIVTDVDESKARDLEQKGAVYAKNLKEIADYAKIVITMLPSSPQVEEVMLDDEGLLNLLPSGSVVIDMSSISPVSTKLISAEAASKGITALDAPVTGGVKGAEAASLTIIVGGEEETYKNIYPLLEAMGKKIFYAGPSGTGQVVKICNQILVGITCCAISEALVLGTKAGIDPKLLSEILSSGAAQSWLLDNRTPTILRRQFEAGFTVDHQHKDLMLAIEAGNEYQVPLYLTGLSTQLYQAISCKGMGGNDNSCIIRLFEEFSGVECKCDEELLGES